MHAHTRARLLYTYMSAIYARTSKETDLLLHINIYNVNKSEVNGILHLFPSTNEVSGL